MANDDVKMSVRIPKGEYAALKDLAKKDGRTLQGYVVRILGGHITRKASQETVQ